MDDKQYQMSKGLFQHKDARYLGQAILNKLQCDGNGTPRVVRCLPAH